MREAERERENKERGGKRKRERKERKRRKERKEKKEREGKRERKGKKDRNYTPKEEEESSFLCSCWPFLEQDGFTIRLLKGDREKAKKLPLL